VRDLRDDLDLELILRAGLRCIDENRDNRQADGQTQSAKTQDTQHTPDFRSSKDIPWHCFMPIMAKVPNHLTTSAAGTRKDYGPKSWPRRPTPRDRRHADETHHPNSLVHMPPPSSEEGTPATHGAHRQHGETGSWSCENDFGLPKAGQIVRG
jgi:hypothetical protein